MQVGQKDEFFFWSGKTSVASSVAADPPAWVFFKRRPAALMAPILPNHLKSERCTFLKEQSRAKEKEKRCRFAPLTLHATTQNIDTVALGTQSCCRRAEEEEEEERALHRLSFSAPRALWRPSKQLNQLLISSSATLAINSLVPLQIPLLLLPGCVLLHVYRTRIARHPRFVFMDLQRRHIFNLRNLEMFSISSLTGV